MYIHNAMKKAVLCLALGAGVATESRAMGDVANFLVQNQLYGTAGLTAWTVGLSLLAIGRATSNNGLFGKEGATGTTSGILAGKSPMFGAHPALATGVAWIATKFLHSQGCTNAGILGSVNLLASLAIGGVGYQNYRKDRSIIVDTLAFMNQGLVTYKAFKGLL